MLRASLLAVLALVGVVGAGGAASGQGLGESDGVKATGARRPGEIVPVGKFADLPGVRLFYREAGADTRPRYGRGRKKDTIVLLHANTSTSERWEHQLEVFARAGYHVLAPDRRGWGQSIADPATGPQPGFASEDVHELVEYLKIDKFHLLGVAGGGFTALDYAAWHGDRLLSLIVSGSTGSVRDQEILDFSARLTVPGLTIPTYYREVGASYRGANPEGLAKWLEEEEHARQPGAPAQPQRSLNTFAKLETINVRTLVMAPDADLISPPQLMQIWAKYVKNAEWVLIPDAGHSATLEQPEIFNSNVLRFLSGRRFRKVSALF